jgi:hypothetical protein
MNCSPLVEGGSKNKKISNIKTLKPVSKDGCLSLTVIKDLVHAWNNRNIDDKIDIDQSAQSLYRELKSKFEASNNVMWFEHDVIESLLDESKVDEVRKRYFKPIAPETWNSNPKQWLSSIDIEKVLEQYEEKYPEFISYGALPIDFALKSGNSCVINNICAISIEALMKRGKRYIGVVFNLDKHTQSGSHWISLFVNIKTGEINFWDSIARPAPPEVEELMDKISKQLLIVKKKENDGKYKLYSDSGCTYDKPKKQVNEVRHQFENTECGMYSLYFIIEQLDKGKSFDDVCKNIIRDARMNAMRKEYFIIRKVDKKAKSIFSGLFT